MRKNSLQRGIFGLFFSSVSATVWLIIINVFLFFVFTIILAFKPEFLELIELNPSTILGGRAVWTLLTSMFMHQGGFHLLVNMITLFFIGGFCEKIIGRKRYLLLYFLSGILAGLFFVAGAHFGSSFSWGPSVFGGLNDYAAGASGALFGLLGVLAVLIPRYRVYLVAGPIIIILGQFILLPFIPESFQSMFLIIANLLAFLTLIAMFSFNPKIRKFSVPIGLSLWIAPIVAIVPLVIISFFVRLPIGNSAHFGGLVVGLGFGLYLISKYPKKVVLLRKMLRAE